MLVIMSSNLSNPLPTLLQDLFCWVTYRSYSYVVMRRWSYVGMQCSKCECQGHNLFYVDNTAQVRGGLRGTLGEE